MAYFSNGSEGDYYEERYCHRCVHWADGNCPVLILHAAWNYDAVGKTADSDKAWALNTLWPREEVHNGPCAMFHQGTEGAEAELRAYKAWAAKMDKWHTDLCKLLGVAPVHPANTRPADGED